EDDGAGRVFMAYGGDDRLDGTKGDDVLVGGDGADIIGGDDGADIMIGGAGDDVLTRKFGGGPVRGGTRDDIYFGGIGDDFLDLNINRPDENSLVLFRVGDGNDLVKGFDSVGGAHDTILLVGYDEADLDRDGDSVFGDADLALMSSEARVGRETDLTLDLGGGDSITLRGKRPGEGLDASDFAFLETPEAATGKVLDALAYDALPGSYDALVASAPEASVSETYAKRHAGEPGAIEAHGGEAPSPYGETLTAASAQNAGPVLSSSANIWSHADMAALPELLPTMWTDIMIP
ncbi:MAG: hypothetical protein AAF205_02550, partial [Pseudomonadota bacterium]